MVLYAFYIQYNIAKIMRAPIPSFFEQANVHTLQGGNLNRLLIDTVDTPTECKSFLNIVTKCIVRGKAFSILILERIKHIVKDMEN